MIVKVAPNRRDGRSSFQQLAKYVTEGIHQSGEAPTRTSWDRLTQYITADSVLNAMGENVEKTIGVEIGNLDSLATAPVEMSGVARKNRRVQNPVYHYILSWPEHERPDTKDIFAAARDTLAALGLSDHQYIVAIHANTDNIHAHIEVNRVHPSSYKAQHLEFAHATLHKAAREIEVKFGWHHDNGIYQVVEVNGSKQIIRNNDYADPELVPTRPGAKQAEVWSGEESLETWCKGEPAAELKRVLADTKTDSWQDVHNVLAKYGLELRDTGGGGLKVADVSDDRPEKLGKSMSVSASAAFRFLKRGELEAKWGKYQPSANDVIRVEPKRTYKRDPYKRLESRLARKAVRDALYEQYKQADREARQRQDIAREALAPYAAEDKRRFADLREAYSARRAVIKADASLGPTQKQQAYMIAKVSMTATRQQLVQQIRGERVERNRLLPPVPSWREWVEVQAQAGNEAAISALRGMIYQDGRDRKKKEARDAIAESENAIMPARAADTDPSIRPLGNLIWKVGSNGRVSYSFDDGQPAFRDDGERLTFGRADVSDGALAATLQYGAEKWKDGLRISGGDFAFKARVVRMAVEQGIAIQNTELRTLEKQIRDEIAARKQMLAIADRQASGLPGAQVTGNVSLAEDDIETLVRGIKRTASVEMAATDRKTYTGTIVAQNAKHIAQDVGQNRFVIHDRSAFDLTPEHGARVAIKYRSGKASVSQPKARVEKGGR
ncbi:MULTISPECIES: TraI/MobA(P) family conjugative relaxase [unclassified Caballeronia]|uniref:TraI/MobA(P) family conjugative relaxase n=1 Tax=unclassified Caballeronia TaxID=2646786 RepID=UPI00285C56D5|nr:MULTISPECIES: TraI/MobA(P) family conjugative relaxase [unclassified Caballeronia]MDR5776974.1 relaxase/mobilization nuclease domain-containing protein [Caballeronia sp. LZ002]MDR5852451.1 relaxase/mobilization nuclease domain-containing protein [Caballeronia sp. LZ003]